MSQPYTKFSCVNAEVEGLYDFKGNSVEDLPFSKYERLTVISHTNDPNWVQARNKDGNEGLVPLAFVTQLKKEAKLSKMDWFFSKISRDEAEALLTPFEDGLFLVRESTNFPGDYTLCVCYKEKIEHYRIISKDKQFTVDEEEFFDSLIKLVKHYERDADGLCTKLERPTTRRSKRKEMELENAFKSTGWIIDKNDLKTSDYLGKGEFGDVLLGDWIGTKVAVKKLKGNSPAAQDLLDEASLMTNLKHDNLVALLGIVFHDDHILLVTEYMSKGSLIDYLRSRGRLLIIKRDQINFACDTAKGMAYLESKNVVHRDLAARNVLISESGMAKVCDFGLAQNKGMKLDNVKFPIKWTAPEALRHHEFSSKSDMWSFGVLLWEIYSFGRVPYPRIPLADVIKHVENGYRMEAPDDCPPAIYQLMQEAWSENVNLRPAFDAVSKQLESLQNQTPV